MKEKMTVVYCFNEAFAHIAATSIYSLLEKNHEKYMVDVYILWAGNLEHVKDNYDRMAEEFSAQIHFVETDYIEEIISNTGAKKFERDAHNPASNIVYYRFWAAKIVPEDVERIIYVGSDTIVTESMEPMMQFDLQGAPIAMVVDCTRNEYKQIIGIDSGDYYFNDDVAIIDVREWKKRRCTERIVEYLTENGCDLPLFSQDLYNVVLHNDIVKMSPNFAWLSPYWLYDAKGIYKVYGLGKDNFYEEEIFNQAKNNIIIHHFCGNSFIRPWFKNSVHPMAEGYRNYYEKTNWNHEDMKVYKQSFVYKVQYVLYKYFPRGLNVLISTFMQRSFMRLQYHV